MTAFGFLSTYPPTPRGVAAFTAAPLKHLIPHGAPGSRRLSPVLARAGAVA